MKRLVFSILGVFLLINLNTATQAELESLPGVGPVIASRIIEFRKKRGGFRRIEELLAVPGISERLWQALRERVSVGETGGEVTVPVR